MGEKAPLTFKVSGGATLSLDVDLESTVESLKTLLKEHIEADGLKVIYKGRILKDAETLKQHGVKEGHSLHVVKANKTPAADPAATTASTANNSTAPSNPTPAPGAGTMGGAGGMPPFGGMMPGMGGMPGADGGAPNPLQGLAGQMFNNQGLGGMQGGMPPMDPQMIMGLLDDPMMQQMMNQIASDPQMMQNMVNSNPQLREMAQRDPMFASMMQNPQMMQAMMNPRTLRSLMELQQSMGAGGGVPGAGAPNPFLAALGGGAPPGGSPTANTTGAPGTTPAAVPGAGGMGGAPGQPNPFMEMMNNPAIMQAMMGGMGGNSMMGGLQGMGGPPPAADNRPPEERYAAQLTQLENMGFPDRNSNIQALTTANGDINQAINNLLGANN